MTVQGWIQAVVWRGMIGLQKSAKKELAYRVDGIDPTLLLPSLALLSPACSIQPRFHHSQRLSRPFFRCLDGQRLPRSATARPRPSILPHLLIGGEGRFRQSIALALAPDSTHSESWAYAIGQKGKPACSGCSVSRFISAICPTEVEIVFLLLLLFFSWILGTLYCAQGKGNNLYLPQAREKPPVFWGKSFAAMPWLYSTTLEVYSACTLLELTINSTGYLSTTNVLIHQRLPGCMYHKLLGSV